MSTNVPRRRAILLDATLEFSAAKLSGQSRPVVELSTEREREREREKSRREKIDRANRRRRASLGEFREAFEKRVTHEFAGNQSGDVIKVRPARPSSLPLSPSPSPLFSRESGEARRSKTVSVVAPGNRINRNCPESLALKGGLPRSHERLVTRARGKPICRSALGEIESRGAKEGR